MIPRLHLVTDDEILARPSFPGSALKIMETHGNSVALHLRGPTTSGRVLHSLGRRLLEGARATGALLLVNDRVDVDLVLALSGVHLGQRSLTPGTARSLLDSGTIVGVSVHDTNEARAALEEDADYLIVGTIFPTPSHPHRTPSGTGILERVRRMTPRPLLAIGGITPGRVTDVLRAGALGIAVRGGVWNDRDPSRASRVYLDRLEG